MFEESDALIIITKLIYTVLNRIGKASPDQRAIPKNNRHWTLNTRLRGQSDQ